MDILKKVCLILEEEIKAAVEEQVVEKLKSIKDEVATLNEMITELSMGTDVEDIVDPEPEPVKEDKKQLTIPTSGIMNGQDLPEDILNLRLGEIVDNINAVRVLRNQGLTLVRDIAHRSDADLMKLRNFGLTKLHDVRDAIKERVRERKLDILKRLDAGVERNKVKDLNEPPFADGLPY